MSICFILCTYNVLMYLILFIYPFLLHIVIAIILSLINEPLRTIT